MASSDSTDSVMSHIRQEMTSEEKKYAATHLNETDETRENAIVKIKCWLEMNNDLCARIDDFFILRFLRVCKFNFEETKIRIRNYYKQQSDLPKWYMNKDPFRPEMQELLDLGIYLPLRKPDKQGRLVAICRSTRHDPRIHKMSNVIKVCMIGMAIAIKYYPAASIYGYITFIDSIDVTPRHIVQYQPHVLKNMILFWKNYPITQEFIVFNAPTLLDITVRILKSFMSEEQKNRYHVYLQETKQENYFKDIPADILPVEYGGTDGTIQELIEYWKELIEKNRDWFMNEEENDKIISKHLKDLKLTKND